MILSALLTLCGVYSAVALFSFLDKVYTYTFASRLEAVTRSREVKRDMKELKDGARREVRGAFTWPLALVLFAIEKYQAHRASKLVDK